MDEYIFKANYLTEIEYMPRHPETSRYSQMPYTHKQLRVFTTDTRDSVCSPQKIS